MLRRPLLSLLLLTLLFAVVAGAQTTASIKGVVTDQRGGAVAGATVTVRNTAQGVERTTTTNSSGEYEVPALPPGTYSVEIKAKDLQPQIAQNLVLEVGKN